MDRPVYAAIVVDDPPINATYWWRLQQHGFGYVPVEGQWGPNWRNLECAPRFRMEDVRGFADYVEEFGIRGKFTLLPRPAGQGRIDQSVNGYSAAELKELLDIVRERIAPRMDITPEVLTHTMALDPETGALLPHSETAWVSHLAGTGQISKLQAYIRHAYQILHNVGLKPRGLTVGGMSDPSGIAKGEMVLDGYHREPLGQALLSVEREFSSDVRTSFMWTGGPPILAGAKERRAPEACYTAKDGARVFAIHSIDDIALCTLHGQADLQKEIDALVSPDLEKGALIADAEAGKILAITLHTQTLNSRNTGQGLQLAREVTRRLKQRYGARLVWKSTLELCTEQGCA